MKNYSTHICFVSNEIDANLLPLIDSDLSPKKVFLFTTPQMEYRARWISESIKEVHGTPVTFEIVNLPSAIDIDKIETTLIDTVGTKVDDKEDLIVNITGGTKMMTIAAFDFCNRYKISFFYVDIQTLCAYIHSHGTAKVDEVDGQKKLNYKWLNFENYLSAHGYKITDVSSEETQYTEEEAQFIENIRGKYADSIPYVNALACKAQPPELRVSITKKQKILYDFIDYQWGTLKGNEFTFVSDNIRRFVNGIWLEEHVADVLRSVLGKDVRVYQGLSVETTPNAKNKEKDFGNELDVAFFYNNKFHVIEVKTCRFKGGNTNQEYIYKLEGISREMGGLATKKCFLSFFPVTQNMKSRAVQKNISIIDDKRVKKNLQASLISWLQE